MALAQLTILNFGIIENMVFEPGSGFNVVTGETGAGKSLLARALETLCTASLGEDLIRGGAEETSLEATFDFTDKTAPRLDDTELSDGSELILSVSLKAGGRPNYRINGIAVTRARLRSVSGKLVDMHGQSQHLSLLNQSQHLDLLDKYAANSSALDEYRRVYQKLVNKKNELVSFTANRQGFERRMAFLEFQINEIDQARLSANEEEHLVEERLLLSSAEEIKTLADEICQAIAGDGRQEISALLQINRALTPFKRLVSLDRNLLPMHQGFESLSLTLAEIAHDLRHYARTVESNPERLLEVENRLILIGELKRKYGCSASEILEFRARADAEMAGLATGDSNAQVLERVIKELEVRCTKSAEILSLTRSEAAHRLEQALRSELDDLGMTEVLFHIEITRQLDTQGLTLQDGKEYHFGSTGVDRVAFLVVTNPGEVPRPLEKIASTGELSRFTLAFKCALAAAFNVSTLLFDEIDIGIGSRSAEILGQKIAQLAKTHQVICITHLAPVAALATHHFRVTKLETGDRKQSTLKRLSGRSRLEELSLMLTGKLDAASMRSAGVLRSISANLPENHLE